MGPSFQNPGWALTDCCACSPLDRPNIAVSRRTQRVRRSILESTFSKPIAPGKSETFADLPLRRMTSNCVQVLRDRKSHLTEAGTVALRQYDKGTPGRASTTWYRRTLLGTLPTFARTCEGSHTWTVAELEQFEARHPIGSKARLALAHLTYTGVRRSDVVKPGRQRVRDGCITIAVQKKPTTQANSDRTPDSCSTPKCDLLRAARTTSRA